MRNNLLFIYFLFKIYPIKEMYKFTNKIIYHYRYLDIICLKTQKLKYLLIA